MGDKEQMVIPYGNPYVNPYENPYSFIPGGMNAYGPQYYPYLVPIPVGPGGPPPPPSQPLPPPPPPPQRQQKGPTAEEVLRETQNVDKSNKELLIAVIVLVILLVAAGAAIAGILLTPGGIASLTTTVQDTTIGFTVVQPQQIFGPDLNSPNSLAFVIQENTLCLMIKESWFAATQNDIQSCRVKAFSSTVGITAIMEVKFLNNGKTSTEVLSFAKSVIIPKSTTEVTTSTVAEASFSIISTGTSQSGATQLTSAKITVLIASLLVMLYQIL